MFRHIIIMALAMLALTSSYWHANVRGWSTANWRPCAQTTVGQQPHLLHLGLVVVGGRLAPSGHEALRTIPCRTTPVQQVQQVAVRGELHYQAWHVV